MVAQAIPESTIGPPPSTSLDGIPTAAPTTTASSGITVDANPFTRITQTDTTSDAAGLHTTVKTLNFPSESDYSSALNAGIIVTTTSSVESTSVAATSPATTSAAAGKSNGSNLGVLIPAIVTPIAVVLILSFGLFWWIMRRRAKKAFKEEPEFVMEKRKRARQHSRDDSTHSNSSTRKLVTNTSFGNGMSKEPVPAIREIQRPSMDVFSDNHEVSSGLAIGVAKSPHHSPSHSRQNSSESQNPSGTPSRAPVAVRNFSRGPIRPSTATNEQHASPQQFARDRSMSNPGSRPIPPNGVRPDARGQTSMLDRPDPRRPPPNLRGPPLPMGAMRGPPRGPPADGHNSSPGRPGQGPGSRPLQEPMIPGDRSRNDPSRNRPIVPPPAIETQDSRPPQNGGSLNPPTPTGAYNGASPISQYSPIIKEHPKLDGSPHDPSTERVVQNADSPGTSQLSSSFTEENMRIARLADSSRLGFHKDTNNKALPAIATSHPEESTIEQPKPSPRLPPPATRDAPPLNFPPPPPPPADSPTMPSHSRRADSFANDRRSMRSMVSRLSDDEYVDMDVDDVKSDVSSLDERERWDMEHDTRGAAGSRAANNSSLGGYGGMGAAGSNLRLPLVQQTDKDNQNKQNRF